MSGATDATALKGARCLVTGGAGFIGSHIVDMLLKQGADISVLDNFSTGYRKNLDHIDPAKINLIEGDAADESIASTATERVDFVFHLAAMASVPRSMREPSLCHAWCATSTVNLLKGASDARAKRFVFASTSAAYGDSRFVAKRESDPTAPLSPYASSKLSGESYCKAFSQGFGLETVVLRYFNVFGPRQDPESEYSAVIPRFVAMILAGQDPIIYGDGQQSRDFVFVTDIAKANRLAATVESAAGGTFNIGRGERTTLLELLNDLQEILGQKISPQHHPPRAGDVRDSLADITEARSRLCFEPDVTVRDGLKQSVAYYRSLVETSVSS